MDRLTIATTTASGLCTSCGICKGICPKDCINWAKQNGMYWPTIDSQKCIRCGLCADVCPGLGHSYSPDSTPLSTITGPVLQCFNAWSSDPDLRHISASGGVITSMTQSLLSQGKYDSVFCLYTYDYREQLCTARFTYSEYLNSAHRTTIPKSRYLPVSHEAALRYMKDHREERIILIATPCALRGLLQAIDKLSLNRENYLLIGLFCDSIFNYNVLSYLENQFCSGSRLTALHFKNKESGGWPGNMKLYPENSDTVYVSSKERGRLKEYFMPERCLYCVDKLNVQADLSIGDNYTSLHSSKLGSNSVILRTKRGMEAWCAVQEQLVSYAVDISDIQEAQYLDGRINHLYFGMLKAKHSFDLNPGVPVQHSPLDYLPAWRDRLKKLESGAYYCSSPNKLKKQMTNGSKNASPIKRFVKRGTTYLDKLWNKKNYL